MDRKLIIGGAVAALVVAGSLAYFVFRGGGQQEVREAPPAPVDLRTEIQPAAGQPGAPVPKMRDGRPLPM